MVPALGSVYLEAALRVLDQEVSQIPVARCPLQLWTGIEELAWQSVLLDLDIESDGQSQSNYIALIQTLGSRASICQNARYQAPVLARTSQGPW